MQLDNIAKGVVAALLTDQVREKTGLAYKMGAAVAAVALIGVVSLGGFWRGMAVVILLLSLLALLFVYVSRRFALVLVSRIAPPAELAGAREHFDAALTEADLPTGPVAFLRLIWRLRKGVGPEVERLGEVVGRLQDRLGPELDVD